MSRKNKGTQILNKIFETILKTMSENYLFDVAILFRNTILLFNLEAWCHWYGLTNKDSLRSR